MTDKQISVIINADTRPGFKSDVAAIDMMGKGARSVDFIFQGVFNKIKFFEGYKLDVILYIDWHEDFDARELIDLMSDGTISTLVFSKHKEYYKDFIYYPKWNDLNFLNAIMLARGKYIVHFDFDTMAFKRQGSAIVESWINDLESGKYKYVSYPSQFSPDPTPDTNWDYNWASTRFFICKAEQIDYTEIAKCLEDSNYMYGKYGEKKHKCPWLEHVLGISVPKEQVFYPPADPYQYMIFSWDTYYSGVMQKLNGMDYSQVLNYVLQCGGLQFPCDLKGKPI